jgi:hypothetical protein
MCVGPVVWRHNGLWCDRCHVKVETCCEGAPQATCIPAVGPGGDRPSGGGGRDTEASEFEVVRARADARV